MQTYIALIVTAGATWFVARTVWREWRREMRGCGHCALRRSPLPLGRGLGEGDAHP